MSRKFFALLTTLVAIVGLGLGSSTAANASVVPHHGHYTSHDYAGRVVSLSFNGTQASHIMVGHQSFGSAHVSNGAWHETCSGGYCTKGAWKTDTLIEGFWRHGGSGHWTAFSLAVPTASTRYNGNYLGSDISSNPVQFTYRGHLLSGFRINGHAMFADATVTSQGVIPETCRNSWCFKGAWQDDYTVDGFWRDGTAGAWHYWEARAISS